VNNQTSVLAVGARVKHIVTNRVGTIERTTRENGGTKFVVRWPNGGASCISEQDLAAA
jgi:hypothetical protein